MRIRKLKTLLEEIASNILGVGREISLIALPRDRHDGASARLREARAPTY